MKIELERDIEQVRFDLIPEGSVFRMRASSINYLKLQPRTISRGDNSFTCINAVNLNSMNSMCISDSDKFIIIPTKLVLDTQ